MKILAIRGKNLASLAGEFSVDFQQEPLQSSGLFAISGPTGAGKSTLLDALCVALYDDTPRLLRAGGTRGVSLPDVRGELVTPYDPRNLLRRGAADGYAEVDFVGNDGLAYRARWSVRRSRSKVDGALQPTTMALLRLPELQPVGGTKLEVKAEIARCIGLSFDQFTRAVLLAQNEFSTFLKADDNERGELLETLTGNLVYTEISRRAFERAKEELAAVRRLEERLADQRPLAAEERERIGQECATAATALAMADAQLERLARQLRWRQDDDRLVQGVREALAQVEAATVQRRDADGRAAQLLLIESVQPARPLVEESRRIGSEMAGIRLAIGQHEQQLLRAGEARTAALQALQAALDALREEELAQSAAAARLDQAKALDANIAAMRPGHESARHAAQQAELAALDARKRLADREQAMAALRALQTDTEKWLAENSRLQPLAESWQRWDTLFAQASQQALDHAAAVDTFNATANRQQKALALAQQADAALQAARETRDQAQSARDAAAAKLDEFEAQDLPGARQVLHAQREQLTSASQLWTALQGGEIRVVELQAELGRQRLAADNASKMAATAQAQQPALDAVLAQSERALRIAEAACGETAEQLRARLEEDVPCPVCGATDHPYRQQDLRLDAMLADLRAEVARARTAAQQGQALEASQRALASAALAQQQVAGTALAALDTALADNRNRWLAHPLASADIGAQAREAWLGEQLDANAARQRQLDTAEQARRSAALAKDTAQKAYEKSAAALAVVTESASVARLEAAAATQALAAADERRQEMASRLSGSLAALDDLPLDTGWQTTWRSAPTAFHARCKQQALAWQGQQKAGDERKGQLQTLQVEVIALSEAAVAAQREAARAAEAWATLDGAQKALIADRAALFDGKPVRDVEAAMAAALLAARNRHQAGSDAAQQAELAVSRCTDALEMARTRLAEMTQTLADALARLDHWLDAYRSRHDVALDQAALQGLLATDPGSISAERAAVQALDTAVERAQAVARERQARQEAHAAERPEDWPAASDDANALQSARNDASAQRQLLHQQATALQLTLQQDDARRTSAAELLRLIAQQEAVQRRWAQLNELIGSADGKKFRNYAQQFTLDVLLGYANRHLGELARRYRLERIADTLALMVVDQDMGEELRSVHSLSGGESFLVSLALALGLASLSSNRVKVESLFIDEGFGSLDAETLRVAMDALDGLQAMGRKVGVISHVQEMTERIATRIMVRRGAGGSSELHIAQG